MTLIPEPKLRILSLGAGVQSTTVLLMSCRGDLPKLDTADPTAVALLYVEDAANVDTSNPLAARFEAGQDCANCAQIQSEEGDWRPCGIFPGKAVAAAGWCSVWVGK